MVQDLQSKTGLEHKELRQEDETLKKPTKAKSYSLTETQTKLLELISKYPFLGTAQIYRYLRLSARKGNELRKKLIDMGLIRVEEQRSEKGWKKYWCRRKTQV